MLPVMIGVLILSGITTVLISSFISRKITQPIEDISFVLSEISSGNLEKSIPEQLFYSSPEIIKLAKSAEFMRKNLNKAFRKIEFDKEHLEHVVEERTRELSDVNKELTLSLQTLEEQQALLIEAEKHKLSRYLIQNLSHRLNTPIGSTVIATDFLINLLEDSDESVLKSLEIISSSQQKLKEIGDSLKILMTSYDDVTLNTIHLRETIDVCVAKYMMENDIELDVRLIIPEHIEVKGSGMLLLSIIKHLLTYSMKSSGTAMKVVIDFDEATGEMIYRDDTIRVSDKINILNLIQMKHFQTIILV